MKRRLAMLLALSLTFTMLPVNYAGAAEVQETVAAEEAATDEETAAVVEEVTEETEEVSDEAVVTEETNTEATTEETVVEETAAVEESTTEETAEETEAVAEETTEDAGEGSTTNTEIADEEEPEIVEETTEVEVVNEAKAGVVKDSSGNVVQYITADGSALTNTLRKIGNYRYYFGSDGYAVTNQWVTVSGRAYYFGDNGASLTGWQTIDGKVFYFGVSDSKTPKLGAAATGKVQIDGKYYIFADKKNFPSIQLGTRLSGFRKYNGDVYYLVDSKYPASKNTGVMLTGWRTIDGYKYYFGSDGVRRSGFTKISGKTYYFAEYSFDKKHPGRKVTGISKIGGKYYFLNDYGVLKTGWVVYKGVRGYYNSNGAATTKGWKQKDDEWYYLKENGMAKTGWLKLSSTSVYYLDKNQKGAMVVGPFKLPSGKIVFFDLEGRRATTAGWKNYGKYYYYTNSCGTCYVNTTKDGIELDEDGKTEMSIMDAKAQGYSSNSDYLILVDKSTYTVCVYKGKKNNWTRIKGEWRCTHGGSRTPAYTSSGEEKYITVTGRLTKRSAAYGWGDFEYTSAAFCMNLSSGNFIHSVLFNKGSRSNPYNLSPVDGKLGTNWSHGCIRLTLENANWVWNNIPAGTRVVVYNS